MSIPIDSFSGEYRYLSNFWPSFVCLLPEEVYSTVEHAYQAAKSLDSAYRERVRVAPTPGAAKRLGRAAILRSDWETIKVDVMRYLVAQKFSPGSDLAAQLLSTGDRPLIEGNTWGDRFWGVCGGVGQNWLGTVLMETRAFLRSGK